MSPLEADRNDAVNRVLKMIDKGRETKKTGKSYAKIKANAKTLPWAHLHHVPRNYIAMGKNFYVIVGREGYYRQAKKEEFINVISCFSLDDYCVINLIQFSDREIDDYLFEIARYEELPF